MSSRSPRRLLRATGGVAGLVGIASCTGWFENETDATGDSNETDDPGEGDDSDATADCAAELERALRTERLRRSAAVARRGRYPDAFEGSVLDRARETADRVAESVVTFDPPGTDARWSLGRNGTGWFRTPHEIVTNAHSVEGIREREGVTIAEIDGVARNGDRFDLELVDSQLTEDRDVAVLRTEYEGTPLSVGESTALEFEQPLVQVGNPAGFGDRVATVGRFAYDHGAYAAADADDLPAPRATGWFVSGVPAQGGNSGSPVVTLEGDVVGMTTGSDSMVDDEHPPEPDDAVVYDRPLSRRVWTEHQSIETIEDWLDRR